MSAMEIPADTLCARCGGGQASTYFGDALSLTHGGGVPYCERCVVEVQLAHAQERAALIPELEQRLAGLGGPATRVICGYPLWGQWKDKKPLLDHLGDMCVLDREHEGDHDVKVGE